MKSWAQWLIAITIVVAVLGISTYAVISFLETGTEHLADADSSSESGANVISDAKSNAKDKGNKKALNAILNAGEAISKYHEFYNNTLGWGGWQSVDWKNQEQHLKKEIKALEQIIKKQAIPKSVRKDLQNVIALANMARQDHDSMTLRYIHRIFHDLDIAFNGYNGSDKIWGATYTYSKGTPNIESYIDKKGGL